MYTAIVVYHAPQMKNWRNIIVDSLVRITASGCRDREFLRQPDDDMRPRWQDDVRILGPIRHGRARSAAHDAADDGALLIPTQDATQYRARDRARSHLGGITRGDSATLVDRLERVDRRFDGVRSAAYSDARHAQRQGPRRAGIGRRFDVSDLAIDDRAGGGDDLPRSILHVVHATRRESITPPGRARSNPIRRPHVPPPPLPPT